MIMGWKKPLPLLVAVAALATLMSCSSGSQPRQEVLADVADTTIIPAFERLEADTAALTRASTSLCAELNEGNLTAARTALARARASWSFSEAMSFGPVESRRSEARIDYRLAADEIEELIEDPEADFNAEYLATQIGADQRGLQAVEYLLGGPGDEAATLSALSEESRCNYLVGISEVAADEAAAVSTEWSGGSGDDGPYRETYIDPDSDSLETTINTEVVLLSEMADMELGPARSTDGDPDPQTITEGPAQLGVEDFSNRLSGIKAVLVGDDGNGGLSPLLTEDLARRLTDQLDQAIADAGALESPLRSAVVDQPGQIEDLYIAIEAVQKVVVVEVVAQLDVTLGFDGADGDSGA